jgi:hypothetical protein
VIFDVALPGGRTAPAVHAADPAGVARAVEALALGGPHPVVTVIGGAGGLAGARLALAATVFDEAVAPAIRAHGAAAVDGGTDSGVMALLGHARRAGSPFPLIGVAALGTVQVPGHPASGTAALEPNHSHFVLVPGTKWGDEAPYLPLVADAVAGARPAVTVLINGGEVSFDDAARALAHRRPLLVLGGTGRTADRIAAAVADPAGCGDERAATIARSPLVRVVAATDSTAIAARLDEILSR